MPWDNNYKNNKKEREKKLNAPGLTKPLGFSVQEAIKSH